MANGSIDICPTVTADTAEDFQKQMETVAQFGLRVHIDIADGTLTPNKLMAPSDVWWPGGVRADLHVMSKRPLDHLETLVGLMPQLIIVQGDADGDFAAFARELHEHGIETGVALMPDMQPAMLQGALDMLDHVLIFSGNLGSFGGSADLNLLDKVQRLKAMKPTIEIGWDGGINADNAAQLAAAGVEVLNVGGYIHNSPHPRSAYAKLEHAVHGRTEHADVLHLSE